MTEREEQLISAKAETHLTPIDLLDSVRQSLIQSKAFQQAAALNFFEGSKNEKYIKFLHHGSYYEINFLNDSGFLGFSKQSGLREEIVTIIASTNGSPAQNGYSYKKLEEGKEIEVIINSDEAKDKILQIVNL